MVESRHSNVLIPTVVTESRAPKLPTGNLRIFLSYSRDDTDFADQLVTALNLHSFECAIDRHAIHGGEDWKRRLGTLIAEADTIVFVLSRHSATSSVCAWEVEEAARLNKRILPVLPGVIGDIQPPPQLQSLNYVYFYPDPKLPGSGFGSGLAQLVSALVTDIEWLREHTRLLQRAREWDSGGRPANRLLSGHDIASAKAWAAERPNSAPALTALHLDYLNASESEAKAVSHAQRKQLEAMAVAQGEREKALQKAEAALEREKAALSVAAREQQNRLRARNIALSVLSILVVVSLVVAWHAFVQTRLALAERDSAETARRRAEDSLLLATKAVNDQIELARRILNNDPAKRSTTKDAMARLTENIDTRQNYGASNADLRSAHNLFASQLADLDFADAAQAAKTGDAIALRILGMYYFDGKSVTQDYARARELFEEAAAKGDAGAMVAMAMLYQRGAGVVRDNERAGGWYERAAAQGSSTAMYLAGAFYINAKGAEQDFTKGRAWLEKAAAAGSAGAMRELGVLFVNGSGVARDYSKAHEWLEKAAAAGDVDAMHNVGVLYGSGWGVAIDHVMARRWYEKAAAKGNAKAMSLVGFYYILGMGVTQSYSEGREWLERAAEKGNGAAMQGIGMLYHNGHGVSRNLRKAREWYEKAVAVNAGVILHRRSGAILHQS